MSQEEDIEKVRRDKVEDMIKRGIDPYPSKVGRTHTLQEVLSGWAALLKKKSQVTVLGRVFAIRGQGGVSFFDLKDESGAIQVVFRKDNAPDYQKNRDDIDTGDFTEVTGVPYITKRGEKSIDAKSVRVVAKSLRPLPSEWYGLKDTEERFRKRYLDLLLNEGVKKNFVRRSEVIREIREFLAKEGFMEAETPILQPLPGGAKARPFVTQYNALDSENFYLRIAPELYLKRLLVGGFEKIYELGKVFRNEGLDRDHNPEFTMLELYSAYWDYKDLIKFVKKMFSRWEWFPNPKKWDEITFAELFKEHAGKNWRDVPPQELDNIYKHEIRTAGKIKTTTLVVDYPESMMSLAKIKKGGNGAYKDKKLLTESFQLIAGADIAPGGPEIVKGFSELNDPVFQREQMARQEQEFRAGDKESSRLDEDFLESLKYGMPPAAGMGIGIDRLVTLATKSHAVKEIILFPTMKTKE